MLEYLRPTLHDLDEITELYKTYLNDGTGIREYIREGLERPDYAGAICRDGGRLVGIFSARPGIEFTCGHEELIRQITERWGAEGTYTADMIAVPPEYRGRGIARELARMLRESLLRNGARQLVIEEWRRRVENDMPVSGVIKYIGRFELLGRYKNFYARLGEYGMTCPECGKVCTCGAQVCVVELLTEQS